MERASVKKYLWLALGILVILLGIFLFFLWLVYVPTPEFESLEMNIFYLIYVMRIPISGTFLIIFIGYAIIRQKYQGKKIVWKRKG